MKRMMRKPIDADGYIAEFPKEVQITLTAIRDTIRKAAPKALEVISYGMPAYKLNGMLVCYAAYEHHIGFYPTPSGISTFKKELSAFKSSKGAVQFPIGEPVPLSLIARIVKFRVKENQERLMIKTIKK